MHPRDVMACRMGLFHLGNNFIERHRGGVHHDGAVRCVGDHCFGHQRARVQADGASRYRIAPANGEQIGSARPRANKPDCHSVPFMSSFCFPARFPACFPA